jgi:hypothetical protein
VGAALGLPAQEWVDGPAGAWAALVPLAAIAWLLVRVPLADARRSGA